MSRRDILALQSQIRGLSERLWHLEQTVRRLPTPTDLTPQADITPLPPPPTEPEPTTPPPVTPPTSLTEALAARKSTVRHEPPPATPSTEPAPVSAPITGPQRLDRINKTLEAAKKRDAINLEWLVGGRIYAILGAIVVIAGAGLFLKLAWDLGWFEIIPDAWKCILAASFGGALLVTGEYLRKKWGPIASIGCSAAGLGVIYASAYAAYAVFQLVPHQVGFAMLAATAALGVFIGARARLVSVAIVSMLGAYLTPLFFLDVEPTPLVLPTYLIAILITALILCARLGGRFVATRAIAWWGTVLFGTFWVFANAADHPIIACAFLALSWCAMQGELTFTCLRASASPDNLTPDAPVTRSVWARIRPFMVSFSTSAWAGFMAGVVMNSWHHEPWMATAAGFAATTALGLWLAGHMRVLRDAPESDRERLGATFIAQAGVFLIMTVALGLAGWLEVAAWIAMGTAAIAAGRWMRARPLDIYGIITLSIASLRLVLLDKPFTASLAVGADVAGLYLTRWSAMMALAAAAWIACAELIRRTAHARSPWIGGAIAMQLVGFAMLAIAPIDENTAAAPLAWVWLAMSCAAFIIGVASRRAEWRWTGATGIATAILAGVAGYEMWEWTDIVAPPLMHPAWWFAFTAATVWTLMGRNMARRLASEEMRSLGTAIMVSGAFTFFLASTLEVARAVPQLTDTQTAQRAAVSIWWGLCAVGMLAAGFLRKNAPIRYVGLSLLGLATLKAVVFDLIDVSAGWRVASFVLLGVLMIAVAAVYSRLTHLFDDASDDDHSTDETGVASTSPPEATTAE